MNGFEILFSTIKSDLKSKNDLLVAITHFQCIQNGFVCVGTGEEFPERVETGSELLPSGWNQSDETYILRYVNPKTDQKLLVKAVKLSELLVISALIIGNLNASSHHIKIDDHISNNFQSFENAFVSGSVDTVSEIIKKEVIQKTFGSESTQRTDNTNANRNTEERQRPPPPEYDPLRVGPPRMPNYGYDPIQGGQWPPPIGGADLDPFGRGVGGMLMDPRGFPAPFGQPRNPAPGLPRGAVPPGARFDPFGPPGVGPNGRRNPRQMGPDPDHMPPPGRRNPRQMGPDPDHMPPPGYDDMFM